ncbi:hypothetical protein D3C86_1329030 [compost metagenome]
MKAFRLPIAGVLLLLVKKLTVIGIIGNTHGMMMAANPPKNARKNVPQSDFSVSSLPATTGLSFFFSSLTAVVVFSLPFSSLSVTTGVCAVFSTSVSSICAVPSAQPFTLTVNFAS